MASYVNPKTETKEQFLLREGKQIDWYIAKYHTDFKDNFLVALINNHSFSAAAIAFDEVELESITDPNDIRPIQYFIVPLQKLLEVSDLEEKRKK